MSTVPDQLEKLAGLLREGLITRQEFEEQKRTLLESSLSGSFPPVEGAVALSEVGAYRLLGLIGEGGMGAVYRGRHRSDAIAERQGGDVAIKVMHGQFGRNPMYRDRFEREASLGLKLRHPSIVRVHDLVVDGGTLALVMDLVAGRPLAEAMGPPVGPIPWERARPLFRQLLDAVGYAHDQGVVHRDLKPDNVLLTPDGSPRVIDFGIAKDVDGSGTRTGTGMGTVEYMAPEQYTDAKAVDRRADIYSLGMMLYEMLAGRLPWDEGTPQYQILAHKADRQLVAPSAFCADIPVPVMDALALALAVEPAYRPASTGAFAEALDAAAAAARQRPQRPTADPAPAPPPPAQTALPTAPPGPDSLQTVPGPPPPTSTDPPAAPTPLEPRPPTERSGRRTLLIGGLAALLGLVVLLAVGVTGVILVLLGRPGFVIESEPPGATVTALDTGEVLGKTPLELERREDLPRGPLQIQMDGLWPEELDGGRLRAGDARVASVALQEPPRISITADPEGAAVYRMIPDAEGDGVDLVPRMLGTTPLQWRLPTELAGLDGVAITLRATATGRVTVDQEVPVADLAAGEPVHLVLGRGASLSITGDPVGARVDVTRADGFEETGEIPMDLPDLEPGSYRLKVSKSRFRSLRESVTLESGDAQVVKVDLEAEIGTSSMATGDPIILGALDKSVIDNVIRQHLSQIRYCYQKELNKNPALYGKIVIKFVIAKNGSVSSAKTHSTSMNNAIVENCICQRFMRFQFPQPKGGGIVIVSYPFVFKSG